MPRRPPKKWFYRVVRAIEKYRPEVKDARAVAGWLWYHGIKRATKKAILKAEALDPGSKEYKSLDPWPIIPFLDPELKPRKNLIANPPVLHFQDFEGPGIIRVLTRTLPNEKFDHFPEFAVTPRAKRGVVKKSMKELIKWSLQDAGFTDELRGKWVLRTNKFNIFVYL